MNLKLRKISKLNIVMAVVMCAVLLFCFCSKSYVVQAADESFDYSALHFNNILCKSGYWGSDAAIEYTYCTDKCLRPDSDNMDDSYIYGDDSYLKNEWLSFVGSYDNYTSFSEFFDLYVFAVEGARFSGDHTLVSYYIVVPKGSMLCTLSELSPEKDGVYYKSVYIRTPSDNQKCFVLASSIGNNISKNKCSFDVYYSGYYSGNEGVYYYDDYRHCANVIVDMNIEVFPSQCHLAFVNFAQVDSADNIDAFLSGDTSVAVNSRPDFIDDSKKYPSESFYWDSMTCKPSVVGVVDNKNKYCFAFNYSYSCPLMLDPTEMFSCSIIYNSEIRYQDGKGRMYSMTDSKQDTFSLNKHKNGYSNNSLCLNGGFGGQSTLDAMNLLISGMLSFLPGTASSEVSKYNQYTVKSAKIYVTVFLYHVPDPDTLFSNSDIIQSAKENMIMSTDVRSFSFDLFDLSEDKSGTEVKPTVVTEDVLDDAGNVVNKKVTDVVSNDDSGKTVINITIDNSNKVEDKNNNVNVPVNGGGGPGDSDDKNTTSFWKYVTGIVAFFTALLNSDSGLFAVIASYFKFIPADFWSVTIGAIVVIAVLSIYRLAKKGG